MIYILNTVNQVWYNGDITPGVHMKGKKTENVNSEEYTNELKQRLIQKTVINENGCWLWTGCTKQFDYGVVRAKRKNYLAHRLAYEIFKNELPGNKYVCHSCDTPRCINPDHLFLGTQTENMFDAKTKKRMKSGEDHYSTKLSKKDVEEIRVLVGMKFSQRKLAKLFSVSQSCIGQIARKQRWT